MFLTPLATFDSVTWDVQGLTGAAESVNPVLPFPHAGLIIGLMALTIFIIFSYKQRKRQMALGKVNFALLLLSIVAVLYSINDLDAQLTASAMNYGMATWLLLAALGFQVMANRGIKRDEDLVRSLDRLR